MPGIDKVPYLTNSSMILDLERCPGTWSIIGGSYIGLEFGQMYRRFGSEVTMLEMGPRLMNREDEDVSQANPRNLRARGDRHEFECGLHSASPRVTRSGRRILCLVAHPKSVGSHLLLAVGRRPNTDDLGLENAGVLRDAAAISRSTMNSRDQVPGIWALGDCNGRGAFTHTSYNDYEIVAANLLDSDLAG